MEPEAAVNDPPQFADRVEEALDAESSASEEKGPRTPDRKALAELEEGEEAAEVFSEDENGKRKKPTSGFQDLAC